jgi:hypothetical protein
MTCPLAPRTDCTGPVQRELSDRRTVTSERSSDTSTGRGSPIMTQPVSVTTASITKASGSLSRRRRRMAMAGDSFATLQGR